MKSMLMAVMAVAVAVTFSAPTFAGEKKEDREEDERGYRLSERSYGAFERLVKLPANADVDSLKAKFRNGVLTISIAKNHKEKKNVRRIKVDKA